MRKIFVAVTVGLLLNLMPVANAEIVAPSQTVQKPDINFCGYALFAQRKVLIRSMINKLQLQLENDPDDAQIRHKLAEAWHELGKICAAEGSYTAALDAFEKAVELEPDNEQFKRDRDDAREQVNSGADEKNPPPKFNGIG